MFVCLKVSHFDNPFGSKISILYAGRDKRGGLIFVHKNLCLFSLSYSEAVTVVIQIMGKLW